MDRAVEVIGQLLKHPVFGIALTLFLSAMAAAGFNTLGLARLLLAGLFFTVAFAVLTVRSIRMSVLARLAIVIGALVGCVLLDHLLHGHAASDERSKKMADRAIPTPPLMLLFKPRQLYERQIFTQLKEEGLAVGHVSFPEGGYSGFTLDNATDDVMLGIQRFTITNMSDRSRQFRFSLHVIGECHNFRLMNDGHGRWQRQLNENDFLATQGRTENGRLSWGISPVTLPPRRSAETSLGFVAPGADERLRGIITGGEIDDRYKVELEVEELPTGKRFSLKLPFGDPPVIDQPLKERVEAAERRLATAPSNLR